MKVTTISIRDVVRHEWGCGCGICSSVTNKSYGASIFLVPNELVDRIKDAYRNKGCEHWLEHFEDELNDLEPYETVYAPHDDGAIKDALEFCKEKGFLILKDIINEL